MNPDTFKDVAVVCTTLGAALQFLRQMKNFPELWYLACVAVVASLGMWLGIDWASVHNARAFVLSNFGTYTVLYGVTLGGTQGASTVSNVITRYRPSASDNMMVPVTNSK
jgi:hypothetical protein